MNETGRDWARYFSYFLLSLFVLLTILFWSNKIPYVSGISIISARYLLSASFQGLAAILAIIISVTLIGLQIASTTYTPRIIGGFMRFSKNPYFLGLLILYISSMLYDFLVLNWITKIDYIKYTDYAFFLSLLCLLYLIPYIFKTIERLEPSTLIEDIRKDIKQYKESVSGENLLHRVVPQFDNMIMSAFRRGDYATFEDGIDTYGLMASEIVEKTGYNAMITEFMFSDIFDISLTVVDDPRAPELVMKSLTKLAEADLEKRKQDMAWRCAREIGKIGQKIIEVGHRKSSVIAYYLNHIGLLAAKRKKGWTTKVVIETLENFGLKVIEAEMDEEQKEITVKRTIDGIRDSGREAKRQSLNYEQVVISGMAVESIEKFKKAAQEKNFTVIAEYCESAISLIDQV